jgi:phosphate transport system substrate-binding protein
LAAVAATNKLRRKTSELSNLARCIAEFLGYSEGNRAENQLPHQLLNRYSLDTGQKNKMKTLAVTGISHPVRRTLFSVRFVSLLFLFSFARGTAFSEAQNTVVLVGSGSTVPAPLYNRWALEYAKRPSNIQMRYLPVGTSEGILHISQGAGDFAAGEVPLTDKERREDNLIELPVALIGIVPIYNLPDVHKDLRLSGEVLAEIFLGEVKTWNAPQIAKLNPGIVLPSLSIQVVNRPAGKGSNYVFTDFLSKASPRFRAQIGVTSSPKWSVGRPAERSLDMTDRVKSMVGSIGYVEYEYALKGNLAQVWVLNSVGKFVKATPESIAAACEAVEAPQWNKLSSSLTNAPGTGTFPITSFTWIYIRTRSSDSARAASLGDFLDWIYTQGQQFASQEGYSELPTALLTAVRKKAKDSR